MTQTVSEMTRNTYRELEEASPEARRRLREEELIVRITGELLRAMEAAGVSKAELARRLDKSKGHVSQMLAGNRNLTVRTIAAIADALDLRPELSLQELTFTRTVVAVPATAEAWSTVVSFTGIPRGTADLGIVETNVGGAFPAYLADSLNPRRRGGGAYVER